MKNCFQGITKRRTKTQIKKKVTIPEGYDCLFKIAGNAATSSQLPL
ncbi:MAG: hypothetical protein ABF251_08135 [Nonlabens sp.]